jgi:lipoate-protein ligase A
MNWRFLLDGALSPEENMATDEAIMLALIQHKTMPTIRFYDWNVPTLSYGYHQDVTNEIDFEVVAEKGYRYVRRPTGGRMVLHKNEVTYSVIAPLEERLAGNISNSYLEISRALAAGLQMMGIEDVEMEKGELNSWEQRMASNPCYTSSSRYEIKYQHKKMIGSAQVRKDNVLLQHGSILLHENQAEISDFIPFADAEQKAKLKAFLAKKTIAINQILEKKINYVTAVQYFQKSFCSTWCNDSFIVAIDKTSYEKENTLDLIENKYKKAWWNLKKK